MLLIKSFLLCEANNFLISVYLVAEDSFHHFLIVTKLKKKMLSQNYNFPSCKTKLIEKTGILLYILRKINFSISHFQTTFPKVRKGKCNQA